MSANVARLTAANELAPGRPCVRCYFLNELCRREIPRSTCKYSIPIHCHEDTSDLEKNRPDRIGQNSWVDHPAESRNRYHPRTAQPRPTTGSIAAESDLLAVGTSAQCLRSTFSVLCCLCKPKVNQVLNSGGEFSNTRASRHLFKNQFHPEVAADAADHV